jgi:DNA-binding PadR family transcriptional regulator
MERHRSDFRVSSPVPDRYHPRVQPSLTPGEWAVLGVVAEGPTHGFAVARLFAEGGELGQIWTLPRPVVYQALRKLADLRFVEERSTERTRQGPRRTIVGVTPEGRRAVGRWLDEPVEHVRHLRSLLLLKLALHDRSGLDPSRLLKAQKACIEARLPSLARQQREAVGFARTLATWRLEASRSAVRFLRTMSGPGVRTR